MHLKWAAALCTIEYGLKFWNQQRLVGAFYDWRYLLRSNVLSMAMQAADLAESDLCKYQDSYQASLQQVLDRVAAQSEAQRQRQQQRTVLIRAWAHWVTAVHASQRGHHAALAALQRTHLLCLLFELWGYHNLVSVWHWWGAQAARSVTFKSRKDAIQLLHHGAR